MFDATALCTVEDRPNDPNRKWFTIDPNVMYPAMVARILEVVNSRERAPKELIGFVGVNDAPLDADDSQAARRYLSLARRLPKTAWDEALKPAATATDLVNRKTALILAKDWFERALTLQVGGNVGIHILADDTYKWK